MILVSEEPIEAEDLIRKLNKQGAGSVLIHIGVCKPEAEGRKSRGVSFSRQGDVEAEMREVEQELRSSFQLIDVVLAKRVGAVEVGQTILFAAVAARDRMSAFGACKQAVDRGKKLKTLKKQELFIEE